MPISLEFDQQLNGMQRMAAQREEVIVTANARCAEQFAPQFGKLQFQLALRAS